MPGLRRATGWTLALAGAIVLLAAVEAGTAAGVGGLRGSRDLVRLLLAVPLGVAALVSLRAGARAEAIGFSMAAACLALAAGADALAAGWISSDASGAAERVARGNVARAATALVVFGAPAVVGARALRIRFGDLWTGPRPVALATLSAAALALVAFPLWNGANVFGNAALRRATASPGEGPHAWPALDAVLETSFFPSSASGRMVQIAVRLALAFPLLELCLHGVMRQAFVRLGLVPFVVGTAFLAPAVAMEAQMAFGLLLGALATGLFAARTGSLLPGLAFWPALFLAQPLWMALGPSSSR